MAIKPHHNVYTSTISSQHYATTMRLIRDLALGESRQIGDILYTKKTFSTEGFHYYNEKYMNHCSWSRYRELYYSYLPQKYPKSDFWIKVIEMKYRGHICQTIASNACEDIYELFWIKKRL